MLISTLKRTFRISKTLYLLLIFFILFIAFTVHFISVATPFIETKARYIAIDIINTQVSHYIQENPHVFSDIISVTTSPEGNISWASVNTKNLNSSKADLSNLMNNALASEKVYSVSIPISNLLGITFLSGMGTYIKIKIRPISKVLIDFESDFSSSGINQTYLTLSLKVKASVVAIIPGIRRGVSVETDIPIGQSVFMGQVPSYYSGAGVLPSISVDK